ncbi:MAG TPA: hypothetical protein VLS25_00980, partial [Dehalococcoidia bacterium]|nr:hypothetical protein [Dehalococcoidia bacterium]
MDQTARPHKTRGQRKLFLAAMAVAIGALVLITAATPRTAFAASYVVDTTSDANLTSCSGDADDCSLRGAMNNAVANAGADTITFDPSVFTNSITS